MIRVVRIFRRLFKEINPQYTLELKDYSESHVSIGVFSQGFNKILRIENTIPNHIKAQADDRNLKVLDLDTKKEFLVTENEIYKNFPVFG